MTIRGKKILFISAGTTLTGVPIYALNMLEWFNENTNYDFTIITTGNGPLKNNFEKFNNVYFWDDWFTESKFRKSIIFKIYQLLFLRKKYASTNSYKDHIIKKIRQNHFDLVYINSASSLSIYDAIKDQIKVKALLHLHELKISVLQFCGLSTFKNNIQNFNHIIAISNAVKQYLISDFSIKSVNIEVIYTFCNSIKQAENFNFGITESLKDRLLIPRDAIVVCSSGTLDWRKGVDIFVQIANKTKHYSKHKIHFIWIGGESNSLDHSKLLYDIEKLNLSASISVITSVSNPIEYFACCDIFMLTSREEPVGMVALEAASLRKPIVCFEDSGGMPEFVQDNCGIVVPYLDIEKMSETIQFLANNKDKREELGFNAYTKVQDLSINNTCKKIKQLIDDIN